MTFYPASFRSSAGSEHSRPRARGRSAGAPHAEDLCEQNAGKLGN